MVHLIFTLIFLLAPLQISANQQEIKNDLTDAIFPRTDPKIIGLIYQMLKVTDLLFTRHNIPYWIDGGTALGAVRHGGIIPWDDDADLVFFMKDEIRVLALAIEFASYGFCLRKDDDIIRLYPSKKKSYPFIDLAGYSLCSDNTLRFAYEPGRVYFFNFFWLPDEVAPLIRIPFGPIELNAPNDVMRYLYTGYGRDCMTHAVYQTHHGPEENKVEIHEIVRIVDYSSAKYEIDNILIPLE